ncbi:SPOR domain-containing protein [Rhodoferax saidenbachensis]|uniref:SPOR domain-containing protein n=1 Tax=Rhodoferax saidenbachensis TaxID=1484693 RepID=A0A1P8K7M2_9BURK|nr:SPOR domain-containing protein [Rhodoferax saidenbachensis]APW42003.1 SPOR domain-containing protein [Rhodoferax saidenbachensis]
MPFFKFRKGGDAQPAPAPAPESVEALRRRARHRLIGAAVLVLMGVIGFPLVFDNQPRPIDVDIPIEIPDRNKVKPLGAAPAPAPSAQASGAVDAPPAATAAATPAAPASAAPPARVATGVVSPAPAPKPTVEAAKPAPKPEPKPVEKPAEKVAEKPAAKPDDGAKARALLDGKEAAAKPASSASAAATGRFVVQVGAYAEVTKAREARMKVERAGLKTYTQVVQSSEGKRIRVRVGPFENKAAADKAADKIKKLDLPAAILEL